MIADELNKLKQTKAQIKQALIDKGQNPTDEFASYVGNIGAIATSSSANNAEVHCTSEFSTPEECYNAFDENCEMPILIKDSSVGNGDIPLNNWSFPKAKALLGFPVNASSLNVSGNFDYYIPNCERIKAIHLGGGVNTFTTTNKLKSLDHAFILRSGNGKVVITDTSNVETIESAFPYYNKDIELSLPKLTNARNAFDLNNGTFTLTINDLNTTFDAANMFGTAGNATNINVTINTNTPIWKVSNSSGMFAGLQKLQSLPMTIDLAEVTLANNMFSNCKVLTNFPIINTQNIQNMQNMFYYCQNMTELPEGFNCDNATNLQYAFYYCQKLTYIPKLNNKAIIYDTFTGCGAVKIEEINSGEASLPSDTTSYYCVRMSTTNIPSLRYMLMKDLGNNANVYSSYLYSDFIYLTNWGIEDESIPLSKGARQSVIDTLITYSIDRTLDEKFKYKNGNEWVQRVYTIKLSTNTKALLTEDEIAQITAKGYTIA